jgi:DNA-binding FadR family transcriptional regulator
MPDQPERYLEFDLQFHLAIARAAQNSILFNLLSLTRIFAGMDQRKPG